MMRERVQDLFYRSIKVKSFTNTEKERDIERFLEESISEIAYFQENKDHFGQYRIEGDYYGRTVVWALVHHGFKDTVILFHHHDTVDIEDYGKFEDIAFDSDRLKEEYQAQDFAEDVRQDAHSPSWIFGRGTADMKAALALQLEVLREYSGSENPKVNVLYLSVADEESYSQGMRAAIGLLEELKQKYDLNYILAVDSEPFESEREEEKVLHLGTVGKLMPVIVTQGILSHIKEPLNGINAISLLMKVANKIDLNPVLAETVKGERSPLPSWSYLRDLKEQYDVSTALRAAGYFSILYLRKSPKELLDKVCALCEEGVEEYYRNYLYLQEQYQVQNSNSKPKVLTFEELLELCKKKEGFEDYYKNLNREASDDLKKGKNYQDITVSNIQKLLDFYAKKEALVIVAVAPPYYPALSSREIEGKGGIIEKLEHHYRTYLYEKHRYQLKTEEYFKGICDISYCGSDKEVEEHQSVLDLMAVNRGLYHIDFELIDELAVPGVNLGPWGKDLHKLTERVYEKDVFEVIPNYLLYLLEHIDELK